MAVALADLQIPVSTPRPASTKLGWRDILGAWKVRWGIGRSRYRVDPGIHAIGSPGPDSPVLVTANYKLTFDMLRRELGGLDLWIMVLDTKGVNVWCAAGKGTFGTEEILRRIVLTGLGGLVRHRELILPQLGAPGVAAHEVKAKSGFRVIYGPVQARDIPAWLAAGRVKTDAMRQVPFGVLDRLVLAPVEVVQSLRWFPLLVLWAAILALPLDAGYIARLLSGSAYLGGAILLGAVAVPLLLPWLPFRAFGLKGLCLGLAWAALGPMVLPGPGMLAWAALSFVSLPGIVYLAMNFTGSTTFTSPTGALKEVRTALPLLLAPAGLAVVAAVADMITRGKIW